MSATRMDGRPLRPAIFLILGLTLFAAAPLGAGELPEPVDSETLSELRGQKGISTHQLGMVNAQITQDGNAVIGGQTGNNRIDSGAFQNARGFSLVVQNTGNDVAIQESLIVNISIAP